MRNYILNVHGEPTAEDDLHRWSTWFVKNNRKIAQYRNRKGVGVSTIFLGTDHNFNFSGSAILFETMVFGGIFDNFQRRYCTRAEALTGHEHLVKEVKLSAKLSLVELNSNFLYDYNNQFERQKRQECEQWIKENLTEYPYLFQNVRYMGFKKKENAAIFKLSQWYQTDGN